jgi:hypothetical protein
LKIEDQECCLEQVPAGLRLRKDLICTKNPNEKKRENQSMFGGENELLVVREWIGWVEKSDRGVPGSAELFNRFANPGFTSILVNPPFIRSVTPIVCSVDFLSFEIFDVIFCLLFGLFPC